VFSKGIPNQSNPKTKMIHENTSKRIHHHFQFTPLSDINQIEQCRLVLHDILTNPNEVCLDILEVLKDLIINWMNIGTLKIYAEPQLSLIAEEVNFDFDFDFDLSPFL
jgi:predicted nucleotidyltransferase